MKLHLYINAFCLSAILTACAQNLPDSVTSANKTSSANASSTVGGNIVAVGGTSSGTSPSGGTTAVMPVLLDHNGAAVVSGASYFIRNVSTSNCLDVTGAQTDDGTYVQPYECNAGYLNQLWKVTLNPDSTVTLTSLDSGKCLDVDLYNVLNADAVVQIYECAGSPNQSFVLTALNGGYRISPSDGVTHAITETAGSQILGEAISTDAQQAFVLIPSTSTNPAN